MKISRKVVALGVACGSIVILSSGILAQFNPQPDPPAHYFGVMGIQVRQHVSLHVANRKVAVTRVSNNDTCRAELRIVNDRGVSVATRQDRILPGQAVSLNFTADPPGEADPPGAIDPPDPDRVLLRAFVLFTGESAHCLSSVEVIDASGRTVAFQNPSTLVTLNPPSDRPGEVRR